MVPVAGVPYVVIQYNVILYIGMDVVEGVYLMSVMDVQEVVTVVVETVMVEI
jgi:hypothetical protein